MASLDTTRPAAMKRSSRSWAKQAGVAVLPIIVGQGPLDIARRAMVSAKVGGYDAVILDTAGRQHVDEQLMAEVAAVKETGLAARNPAGGRSPDRPGRRPYRQVLQ